MAINIAGLYSCCRPHGQPKSRKPRLFSPLSPLHDGAPSPPHTDQAPAQPLGKNNITIGPQVLPYQAKKGNSEKVGTDVSTFRKRALPPPPPPPTPFSLLARMRQRGVG